MPGLIMAGMGEDHHLYRQIGMQVLHRNKELVRPLHGRTVIINAMQDEEWFVDALGIRDGRFLQRIDHELFKVQGNH